MVSVARTSASVWDVSRQKSANVLPGRCNDSVNSAIFFWTSAGWLDARPLLGQELLEQEILDQHLHDFPAHLATSGLG
jgi:hypothetical protein